MRSEPGDGRVLGLDEVAQHVLIGLDELFNRDERRNGDVAGEEARARRPSEPDERRTERGRGLAARELIGAFVEVLVQLTKPRLGGGGRGLLSAVGHPARDAISLWRSSEIVGAVLLRGRACKGVRMQGHGLSPHLVE